MVQSHATAGEEIAVAEFPYTISDIHASYVARNRRLLSSKINRSAAKVRLVKKHDVPIAGRRSSRGAYRPCRSDTITQPKLAKVRRTGIEPGAPAGEVIAIAQFPNSSSNRDASRTPVESCNRPVMIREIAAEVGLIEEDDLL